MSLERIYNTFDIKISSRHQGNLSIKHQEEGAVMQGRAPCFRNHWLRWDDLEMLEKIHNSTWLPNSTTRSGGSLKNEVAFQALRDM